MKDHYYNRQKEITLQNLVSENKRLKQEIKGLKHSTGKNKTILDFHDTLEKDFFSADSLENLIIKLINRLQIRPDIDFVSLCLNNQYLETILGVPLSEHFISKIGVPAKLKYLSIVNESELEKHLGRSGKTLFEKTSKGSYDIFFPGHEDEVRSHAIIPLFLRGQLIGSLNIGSILTRHYYTTDMGPDLLDRLSAKLTIAIDNILSHNNQVLQKELQDQDINRAAILQKGLLPSSRLQTGALQILTYFQPCQKLGGDFYDYIVLSPDRVAIIIADVSGHGISASLIAAMLKFSLQKDNIVKFSPEKMVSQINQRFCQILKHGDFITLCYCIIDTGRSIINLVRAGHPFPILFRSLSNDTGELKPAGPPVGLDMTASYENLEMELSPGDMLFFYTDGLTDAIFKNRPNCINQLLFKEESEGGNMPESLHSKLETLLKNKDLEDDTSFIIIKIK